MFIVKAPKITVALKYMPGSTLELSVFTRIFKLKMSQAAIANAWAKVEKATTQATRSTLDSAINLQAPTPTHIRKQSLMNAPIVKWSVARIVASPIFMKLLKATQLNKIVTIGTASKYEVPSRITVKSSAR